MGQYWALFWNLCIWACFAAYTLLDCLNTFSHWLNQSLSSALVFWLLPELAYSLSILQTYFPAFHACVSEGGAKSIMCSYNAVNGVPSCANGLFQNTVVRDEWGFDGYIVSMREREIEVWSCEVWLCTYPHYCIVSPITITWCDYMSVCMCVCMCIQVCMFFTNIILWGIVLFFSLSSSFVQVSDCGAIAAIQSAHQ